MTVWLLPAAAIGLAAAVNALFAMQRRRRCRGHQHDRATPSAPKEPQ